MANVPVRLSRYSDDRRLRWTATAGRQRSPRTESVEAAVSAALHWMQAARLPLQRLLGRERGDDFFGARIASQPFARDIVLIRATSRHTGEA
jgi:hypothetical protein